MMQKLCSILSLIQENLTAFIREDPLEFSQLSRILSSVGQAIARISLDI